MLRTIFFLVAAIWMLGLMLQFGESVLPLLLVVGAIVLVRSTRFRAGPSIGVDNAFNKTGKFNFTTG
jgi:hypothetical protein